MSILYLRALDSTRLATCKAIRVKYALPNFSSTLASKGPSFSSISETLSQLVTKLGKLCDKPYVNPSQPIKLIVCGPSGVGKDAVIAKLSQIRPDMHLVVTTTSRVCRPGEVNGVDYYFVSRAEFERMRDADELLEWALVYGEYKGVPRQQVDAALAAGRNVVFRVDVQGAATLRRLLPGVVSIFVTAPSEAELAARLVARGTETTEKLAVRLAEARREHERLPEFDYVLVNEAGGLDRCAAAVSQIVDAERARVRQRAAASANVVNEN